MHIVVARTGSPWIPDGTSSPRSGHDTDQIVHHLADAGHEVIYFGRVNGETPSGIRVVQPNLEGIDEFSTAEDLLERLRPAVAELGCVDAWVNPAGAAATWCWPENPNFAETQAWCKRYSAPAMWMCHDRKIPRVCVVTDPKCYPRELEMASMWPETLPVALLSQEARSFPKRMFDKRYTVHAAYSKCEYWMTRGMKPTHSAKDLVIAGVHHAHFGEGRLPKGRDDVWRLIMGKWLGLKGRAERTRICGKGWDDFDLALEHPGVWMGTFPAFESVRQHLARGICGPMIPQWPGFNSTKPRLHALSGSAPLLYGRGGFMTYDQDERVLALGHPARISEDEDGLLEAVRYVSAHLPEVVGWVLDRTKPDFSLLDECLDRLKELPIYDRFGGYERCD